MHEERTLLSAHDGRQYGFCQGRFAVVGPGLNLSFRGRGKKWLGIDELREILRLAAPAWRSPLCPSTNEIAERRASSLRRAAGTFSLPLPSSASESSRAS